MSNHIKQKPKLTIALLAAGKSARFGSPKQLALYRNKTFIERNVNLLCSLAEEVVTCEILVITGAYRTLVHEHLRTVQGNYRVVHNQNWQQGMSSSIKTAVSHCSKETEGLMFVSIDQILICANDLELLISNWANDTSYTLCALYADHKGIPALFPKPVFPKLLELSGDRGAQSLIKSSPKVISVFLPNAELDINTLTQLDSLNSQLI